MSCQVGIERDLWTPKLTKVQVQKVRKRFDAPSKNEPWNDEYEKIACFFVAYHARSVWTDKELASRIDGIEKLIREQDGGPKWDVIRKALGVKIPAKTAKRG